MADLPIRRGVASPVRTRGWDPFERMQELMGADPLEALGRWIGDREITFAPAFEVKESKDAFVFKADLPGVDEKDLDVTVTGDRIQVSGKREAEKRDEGDRYYMLERSFGSFTRNFTLPEGVDADHVDAELKDGVLTLRLPKRPETQPKKIKLGSGGKAKA